MLGKALASQGQNTPETEQLLSESSDQYPDAHLDLAQIMLSRLDSGAAAEHLREYMRRADVPQEKRKLINCAIEKLTVPASESACVLNSASTLAEN